MGWAAAITAVSTGLQIAGNISKSNAEAKASNYNAAIARQNAQIATDQANQNAIRQREVNQRKYGAIRAAYGASGVTGAGSPGDVLADSYTQGALDVQDQLYAGQLKSAGYTNTANLDALDAKNAKQAGLASAAGTLLKGGMQTYNLWES